MCSWFNPLLPLITSDTTLGVPKTSRSFCSRSRCSIKNLSTSTGSTVSAASLTPFPPPKVSCCADQAHEAPRSRLDSLFPSELLWAKLSSEARHIMNSLWAYSFPLPLRFSRQPLKITFRAAIHSQHQELRHVIAMHPRNFPLQLFQSSRRSLNDQQKFPRLLDFPFPPVNRFHWHRNNIHAGRQPLRCHRPSNLPSLRQAPTRHQHDSRACSFCHFLRISPFHFTRAGLHYTLGFQGLYLQTLG
jgi:hypothetical protein